LSFILFYTIIKHKGLKKTRLLSIILANTVEKANCIVQKSAAQYQWIYLFGILPNMFGE